MNTIHGIEASNEVRMPGHVALVAAACMLEAAGKCYGQDQDPQGDRWTKSSDSFFALAKNWNIQTREVVA
jgi:hypothetical protein